MKTNKNAVKKNSKSKKNSNKVMAAPVVEAVATTVTPTVTPAVVYDKKGNIRVPTANGKYKGRPSGSNSMSLVSLKRLIDSLPEGAQIPVGARYLKLMNIAPETQFVSNTSNLNTIAQKYRQTSIATVVDLNTQTETPVETAAS